MANILADALSIAFVIILILLSSTFSITVLNERRRRVFGIITGLLTGVAVGFMVVFIIGGLFFPEPVI